MSGWCSVSEYVWILYWSESLYLTLMSQLCVVNGNSKKLPPSLWSWSSLSWIMSSCTLALKIAQIKIILPTIKLHWAVQMLLLNLKGKSHHQQSRARIQPQLKHPIIRPPQHSGALWRPPCEPALTGWQTAWLFNSSVFWPVLVPIEQGFHLQTSCLPQSCAACG